MILGQLIEQLKTYPKETHLRIGLRHPHSYRGYHFELAFEMDESLPVTVGELIEDANDCLGREFPGWKGGDFKMDFFSQVNVAEMGSCGESLSPILLHCLITGSLDGYKDHVSTY